MLFWKSRHGKLQIRRYNERIIPISVGMTVYHQPPLLGLIPDDSSNENCLARYLMEMSNYFEHSTTGKSPTITASSRYLADLQKYSDRMDSTHNHQTRLSQIILDLQQKLVDSKINLSRLIVDLKNCHEYTEENVMLSVMVENLQMYAETTEKLYGRDYIVSTEEINFNRIISDLSSCIGYQASIKE